MTLRERGEGNGEVTSWLQGDYTDSWYGGLAPTN